MMVVVMVMLIIILTLEKIEMYKPNKIIYMNVHKLESKRAYFE